MKKLFFIASVVMLSGCANDIEYRYIDPNSCISTRDISSSCTEDQAKMNRSKLFDQCKKLGGVPNIKQPFPQSQLFLGVNCLMPDGSVRDLYGEKFKQDTGLDLYN